MSKERKQSGTSALQGILEFLPHFNISLPSPPPTFSLKTPQHVSGIEMYTSAVYHNTQENTGPFEASISTLIQKPSSWSSCKAERQRDREVAGPPPTGGFTRAQSLVKLHQLMSSVPFIPHNHLISSDVQHTAGKELPSSLSPLKL